MYISSFFNEVTGVANESALFQGWRSVTWQRCVSCVRKIGFVFCFGMRARAWEWVCLWVSNSVRLISLSNSLSLNLYRSLCLSLRRRPSAGLPAPPARLPALRCAGHRAATLAAGAGRRVCDTGELRLCVPTRRRVASSSSVLVLRGGPADSLGRPGGPA